MNAPLHDIAAAVVIVRVTAIVGIVVGVVWIIPVTVIVAPEATGEETPTMVKTAMVETAVIEAAVCERATLNRGYARSRTNRCRACETTAEAAAAKPSRGETTAAKA